jgi:NTP pyrophosphatase (non-canonical NTP hydrolase)
MDELTIINDIRRRMALQFNGNKTIKTVEAAARMVFNQLEIIEHEINYLKSQTMKDHELIATTDYKEVKQAADHLGVEVWEVYKSINDLGSNKRDLVYKYIKKEKEETVEPDNVLKSAVETFGQEEQIDMLIEEMAEVIQAISKWRRKRWTHMPDNHPTLENLHEELADLIIVLDQMDYIFDKDKINAYRAAKIDRLAKRIEGHENSSNQTT